jgi:hypothetical protein
MLSSEVDRTRVLLVKLPVVGFRLLDVIPEPGSEVTAFGEASYLREQLLDRRIQQLQGFLQIVYSCHHPLQFVTITATMYVAAMPPT